MHPKLEYQINEAEKTRRKADIFYKFWKSHPLPTLPPEVEVQWFSTFGHGNWSRRGNKHPLLSLKYIGPARSEEEARPTLIDVQYLLRCIFGHATPSRSSYDEWDLRLAKSSGHELSRYEGEGRLDGYKILVTLAVPWFGEGCKLEEKEKPAETVFTASCST